MTSNEVSGTLKDVVAFVDVWSSSKTENYSKPFMQQLQEMGAVVSKRFDKHVTHVVFKNGHRSTWNKAKKTGVKLVSVLWVARCKDSGEHIDEELCPAINEESNISLALNKRTHRCMQPRDIPYKTPENDRSMKRKLGQMIKDQVVSLPSSSVMSPFIIDDDGGIVYSPLSGRAACMARRLKVMKEKRESLLQTDYSASEDDSSDVDVPFSDCHSYSASNRCEGEDQQCTKSLIYDLDACESSNRDATESLPKTGAEKRRKVFHNDDKETVKTFESPCPEGLFGETKRAKTKKASDPSVQRNRVERQASIVSPCLDLLFGGRTISQSLHGLDGQDIKKPRKSSFKSYQADKIVAKNPSLAELFSGNKVTKSAVESKKVVNVHENDPTMPSKTLFSFGECSKSISLSLFESDSLARDASAADRGRGKHHTVQASPLKIFRQRKRSLLTLDARGSPKPLRVAAPEDDGVFDSYFSPANHPDNGRRRLPLLSSLPSEPTPLPLFELEPKLPKRKRASSETDGPGPARAKRRMSLSSGTRGVYGRTPCCS